MESDRIVIGILTSSRADYGIYRPLLKMLSISGNYELRLIVFGTHLSHDFGLTKREIIIDSFSIYKEMETIVMDDSPKGISDGMALAMSKFGTFWHSNSDFDLVFALGDRFEMFAAVASSVPFSINIAHLHGGEETEGALDNKFRHMITLLSKFHFASTEKHADKVRALIGNSENVFNVGALGLDNVLNLNLYTNEQFFENFKIELNNPILCTIHPETVNYESNVNNAKIFIKIIKHFDKEQVIITLPNNDTSGLKIRNLLINDLGNLDHVHLVESFGTRGYFTCMKHCKFLLGNTSSGIIEAASFGKYVINLGDRQKGRSRSRNVIDCKFDVKEILSAVDIVLNKPTFEGTNVYGNGETANKIVSILGDLF
jgi:GDP/UDP-N,N'-diacetylbacillosamine 2-epimerase (hydrolysing)